MSSRRKRLSRSPSDCGSNFFVYMSRYKQKKPVLFFQKPVYCFAASCDIVSFLLFILPLLRCLDDRIWTLFLCCTSEVLHVRHRADKRQSPGLRPEVSGALLLGGRMGHEDAAMKLKSKQKQLVNSRQ